MIEVLNKEVNKFLLSLSNIEKNALSQIKKTYSSNIGYEFMHMGDPDEKSWIRNRIEGPEKNISFTYLN